jgi:hypothetical protein
MFDKGAVRSLPYPVAGFEESCYIVGQKGRDQGFPARMNDHPPARHHLLLHRCHDDLEHRRVRRRCAAGGNTRSSCQPEEGLYQSPLQNSLSVNLLRCRSVQPRELLPEKLSSTFIIQWLTVIVGKVLRDLRFRVHNLLSKDVVLVQKQDLGGASAEEISRCWIRRL